MKKLLLPLMSSIGITGCTTANQINKYLLSNSDHLPAPESATYYDNGPCSINNEYIPNLLEEYGMYYAKNSLSIDNEYFSTVGLVKIILSDLSNLESITSNDSKKKEWGSEYEVSNIGTTLDGINLSLRTLNIWLLRGYDYQEIISDISQYARNLIKRSSVIAGNYKYRQQMVDIIKTLIGKGNPLIYQLIDTLRQAQKLGLNKTNHLYDKRWKKTYIIKKELVKKNFHSIQSFSSLKNCMKNIASE